MLARQKSHHTKAHGKKKTQPKKSGNLHEKNKQDSRRQHKTTKQYDTKMTLEKNALYHSAHGFSAVPIHRTSSAISAITDIKIPACVLICY